MSEFLPRGLSYCTVNDAAGRPVQSLAYVEFHTLARRHQQPQEAEYTRRGFGVCFKRRDKTFQITRSLMGKKTYLGNAGSEKEAWIM